MTQLTPTYDDDVRAEVVADDLLVLRSRDGRRWAVKGPRCGAGSPCTNGAAQQPPPEAILFHADTKHCACPIEIVELRPCSPGSF